MKMKSWVFRGNIFFNKNQIPKSLLVDAKASIYGFELT
jgi:hypothetical protein